MLFLALPSRQLILADTPQQAVVALLNLGAPPAEVVHLRLIPIPALSGAVFSLTPAIIKELNDAE